MARAAALKVYVTPAGFYDAVVAVPSQKAALGLRVVMACGADPGEAVRVRAVAVVVTRGVAGGEEGEARDGEPDRVAAQQEFEDDQARGGRCPAQPCGKA